jgi:hypothetical protein
MLSIAGIAESYYERFQAQKLLAALSNIQVGYTTEVRAKEIMGPFAWYSTVGAYPRNSTADPFDQYGFQNRALSFLHFSTATWVWITVEYKDSIVVEKSVQAASAPRCGGSVSESVRNKIPPVVKPTESGRTVGIGGQAPGPYFVVKVRDDLSTALARRQLDWQIDLSCMTWRKGCTDPRKTLRGSFLPVAVDQRSN